MSGRPGEMAARITAGRQAVGLDLREAARILRVKPRALKAWEQGREAIPRDVRVDMATLYGLPVDELVPPRPVADRDVSAGVITIGSVCFSVEGATDDSLREFLSAVREQRGVAGRDLQVRGDDAVVLAGVLGSTPEAISARIQELLGVREDEAEEMGAWLFRSKILAGAVTAGALAGALTIGAAANNSSPVLTPQAQSAGPADLDAPGSPVLPVVLSSPAPARAPQPVGDGGAAPAHRAKPASPDGASGTHPAAAVSEAAPVLGDTAGHTGSTVDEPEFVASVVVDDQEASLAALQAQLAEQAALIETLTAQLAEGNRAIWDLSRQNDEHETRAEELLALIDDLDEQIAGQASTITGLQQELAAAQDASGTAEQEALEQATLIEVLEAQLADLDCPDLDDSDLDDGEPEDAHPGVGRGHGHAYGHDKKKDDDGDEPEDDPVYAQPWPDIWP